MKIAILGAGNAGCATAADLSIKGHRVTLIKTSLSMHNENFEYIKKNGNRITLMENGTEKVGTLECLTEDLSKTADVDLIMVYVQSSYHENVIRRIAPYIRDGQILLMNPGYLSTSYVLKHCGEMDITVVEATSSFIDCRIVKPGCIAAGFRNVRNPIGVYPSSKKESVKEKLTSLGFPFHYYDSVVAAALHNPNLIVHTIGSLMSIPRIETMKGEYCMYHEAFTPSVWNVLEKLDTEKMDILEHLNEERIPYVEACKFRNSMDDDRDAKEVFFWYAAMETRAKGPCSVNERYITEDVPNGLVMLESLGKQLDIATPVCTALIEIANAALGCDFRANGRTVESLGKENLQRILDDCKKV